MGKVIAIDGPSGSGKSTVAKMISDMLGFKYLDTGALYRAVALGLVRAGVGPDAPDEKINELLEKVDVSFDGGKVFLDDEDVTDQIRTPEAGHHASVFSARRPVREHLYPIQKQAAERDDLAAEGRDMTTVVFPLAWKKIYLDASVEARAQRRYQQLSRYGVHVDLKRAIEDVVERDKRDSERDLAPLRVAEDAVYVDTSDLTIEEVIKKVLEEVRK
jgi:cytidylate kinase